MTNTIESSSGLASRQLCRRLALPYSTWLRWRRRSQNGRALLLAPGPKKLAPLPLDDVRREIATLIHRRQRTRGSRALYRQYRHAISRRRFSQLVITERQARAAQRRVSYRRVRWQEANIAWAIDATEYGRDHAGRKLHVVAAVDLASRYCFEPLVTVSPSADEIAAWLMKLFRRHGPPLFLKRDNGSIFNGKIIEAMLAAQCVIPLNSPARYPRYNGAIEKAIRELKDQFHDCLPGAPRRWKPPAIAPFAQAAAHLRNCRPRRSLHAHTATHAYHHQPRARFTKAARHAAFEWIKRRARATVLNLPNPNPRNTATAWRRAVEAWLINHQLITIKNQQPVSPH